MWSQGPAVAPEALEFAAHVALSPPRALDSDLNLVASGAESIRLAQFATLLGGDESPAVAALYAIPDSSDVCGIVCPRGMIDGTSWVQQVESATRLSRALLAGFADSLLQRPLQEPSFVFDMKATCLESAALAASTDKNFAATVFTRFEGTDNSLWAIRFAILSLEQLEYSWGALKHKAA